MPGCIYRLEVQDGVICLEDIDGPRSLTNDVEAVLDDLRRGGIALDGPIIYRDSEGRWDEIRHAEGRFTRFAPLKHLPAAQNNNREAAIRAIQLAWNNDQVMLDLETVGVLPESGVLSLGAVRFDPREPVYNGESFYRSLNIAEQLHAGATQDQSTLDWWAQQDPEMQIRAFAGSIYPVQRDLQALRTFILERPKSLLWSKGPSMDSVILQSLFRRMDVPWPFSYRADRDVRTVADLAQGKVDYSCPELKALEGQAHHALADAKWQAYEVWLAYRGLGLQREN